MGLAFHTPLNGLCLRYINPARRILNHLTTLHGSCLWSHFAFHRVEDPLQPFKHDISHRNQKDENQYSGYNHLFGRLALFTLWGTASSFEFLDLFLEVRGIIHIGMSSDQLLPGLDGPLGVLLII